MYDLQINSHLILVYISNWKRVKLVLGCSPFEQRHTGELMAGFVDDVCESWGIRSKVNILCGVRLSGKRPLLCGGYTLLSRHELCRIYVLFWSGFDADFYADIEDFVQILCRFLHKKMLVGSSVLKSWFES